MWARWRPALRMAWRDLSRHKVRAVLTMLLVALPVAVGTAASLIHHNTGWAGEQHARVIMGGADALVKVTPFAKVRVLTQLGEDMAVKPVEFSRDKAGQRRPVRRDRSTVALESLLPDGSRFTPAPTQGQRTLSSGGTAQLTFLDASYSMTAALREIEIDAGRAPTAADEAAVPSPMADELGFLDASGALRPDATLQLADGQGLSVVGLLTPASFNGAGSEARVLVPPTSGLNRRTPSYFLVDLPTLSLPDTRSVVASLADHGVAMMPRDVILHPAAWNIRTPPAAPVDIQSLAVGALVVLFGLIEVVLIVGSAFAVSARRQVRDLGLLSASGGSPADVRRVLLAQGLVLGAIAAVLGAAAGVALFRAGMPLYETITNAAVWTRDIDWVAVIGVTLLGALTGLLAALFPAWSISRLTPVAALSGRFPIRPGESTAHRPAFVCVGAGIITLAVAGFWTAREFAPRPHAEFAPKSPLPIALGGLGVLLLVVGTVWSAPYIVRRVAALGRVLPLSGRFSFRDAARHRFRTAAASITLMITSAGAVLIGFGVNSASATATAVSGLPPHSMMFFPGSLPRAPEQAETLLATVEHVVGEVTFLTSYQVNKPGSRSTHLVVQPGRRQTREWVTVVDENLLRYLVVSNDEPALRAFRSGGVVTSDPALVRDGAARLLLYHGRGRQPDQDWQLPAISVSARDFGEGLLARTWISEGTAATLGLQTEPYITIAMTSGPVTRDELTRLAVYGISARSDDPINQTWRWITVGAVGAAGLLTALVIGIAVALSAAEGRSDLATMAAVGAGPWRRRSLGAAHGLFLGLVGGLLGLAVSLPAGLALTQIDGLAGTTVPWLSVTSTLLAVPLFGALAGWVVTPRRLSLVRRGG